MAETAPPVVAADANVSAAPGGLASLAGDYLRLIQKALLARESAVGGSAPAPVGTSHEAVGAPEDTASGAQPTTTAIPARHG